MANAQQLIDHARSVTPAGEEVLAAGVFAVQDDHLANAVGALGGSAVADDLFDNAAAEGAGATGETPGEELMSIHRASCQIHLEKFGAAEHLELHEDDKDMKLTGGIGLLSAYKDGNKRVIQELST